MRSPRALKISLQLALALAPACCRALSGTEGASFLDIPVGARPAGLSGAYSAQADDAYAPVWNPGGLGWLPSTQLATMHLSYFQESAYEFASLAHPLGNGRALGASVQYFRPGTIEGRDAAGNPTGRYSGHYGAYSVAYGAKLGPRMSAGAAGKLIEASIAGVSASAFALDAGLLYRATERLSVAGVISNVGTKLRFLSRSDELPTALRLGLAYELVEGLSLSGEGLMAATGYLDFRSAFEWRFQQGFALRAGYRSGLDRAAGPGGLATGLGVLVWGHELDYAWLPNGDLGASQYLSLVIKFGRAPALAAAPAAPVSGKKVLPPPKRKKKTT